MLNDRDPYEGIAGSLWLLDLLHRVVLPRSGKDAGRFLRERGAGRVLDLACGTGAVLCTLKGPGLKRVGVDRSRAMLRQAALKVGGCLFVAGDAQELPFGQAFDAALVTLALHEMPPEVRSSAWREMWRVVRPGGVLLVLDFLLPRSGSPLSRLTGRVIQRVEKATEAFDPPHWLHSRQFFRDGGLEGWLKAQVARPVWRRDYLWGNIGLVAVERDLRGEIHGA